MTENDLLPRAGELASKIWKTSGSRFNAARRLEKRQKLSGWTMALLAVYVLVIQLVVPMLPDEGAFFSPALMTAGTASLAMLILVMTILEASQAYQLRADRLHRNATDLRALYDRLKSNIAIHHSNSALLAHEIEEVTSEYQRVIGSTDENHEPGDYALLRAQHREDFGIGRLGAAWIRAREEVSVVFWYYLAILGIPIVIALLW